MKTTVEIGKTYALRSELGGFVKDSNGKILETLSAGKQNHMTAQESEWEVPDDCKVTKVNFKFAPIGQSGGGSAGVAGLPIGYTRVEFLRGTGSQYIDTGLHIDNGSVMAVDCEIAPDSGVESGAVFGAQNGGLYQDRAGWSEYRTSNSGWVFWGWLSSSQTTPSAPTERHRVELSQIGLYYNGVKLRDVDQGSFTTSGTCWLFARNRPDTTVTKYYGKIYSFTLAQDGEPKLDLVPCITPSGEAAMYDNVNGLVYQNASGSGRFVAGVDMLTLAIVVQGLTDEGGTLDVDIRGEEASMVWQAISEVAAAKGWQINVRDWLAVSAATTYGLRRTRQMVWCKAAKGEYGAYVDPNGERFSIDRVMAIAGPLGTDPTEYGYEPFDSHEQAAEAWGLVPYVEPEMEEIAD